VVGFLLAIDPLTSRVGFIHPTAIEFLTTTEYSITSEIKHSICHGEGTELRLPIQHAEAHLTLARACLRCLTWDVVTKSEPDRPFAELVLVQEYPFLHYSAERWDVHFSQADVSPMDQVVDVALQVLCDTHSRLLDKFQASLYWKF